MISSSSISISISISSSSSSSSSCSSSREAVINSGTNSNDHGTRLSIRNSRMGTLVLLASDNLVDFNFFVKCAAKSLLIKQTMVIDN